MSGLGLIWAQSTSGVIGRDGGIPWQIPEDLAHFKAITDGHTVVMGRRTWDSLPAKFRPLPRRKNVVVSRQTGFVAAGAIVVSSLDDALTDPDSWVIGGEQIYVLALPRADWCEVTEIDIDIPRHDGDAIAPVLDEAWVGTPGEWQTSDPGVRYRFHRYRRAL